MKENIFVMIKMILSWQVWATVRKGLVKDKLKISLLSRQGPGQSQGLRDPVRRSNYYK